MSVFERSGWGTWIRTKVDGVRVRSPTARRSPSRGAISQTAGCNGCTGLRRGRECTEGARRFQPPFNNNFQATQCRRLILRCDSNALSRHRFHVGYALKKFGAGRLGRYDFSNDLNGLSRRNRRLSVAGPSSPGSRHGAHGSAACAAGADHGGVGSGHQ